MSIVTAGISECQSFVMIAEMVQARRTPQRLHFSCMYPQKLKATTNYKLFMVCMYVFQSSWHLSESAGHTALHGLPATRERRAPASWCLRHYHR